MTISSWITHAAIHAGGSIANALARPIEGSVNMVAGNDTPPPEALFHLGITGMIDERTMQEALLRYGVSVTVAGDPQPGTALGAQSWIQELWNQHYFAQQHLPSPNESFILTNRGLFTEANLDRILERQGFADPLVRQKLANLRYEIPGSSDLVRFSVRHVFEPDLISRLGYDDEFNRTLDFWHKLQGLNYPIFTGPFERQYEEFVAAQRGSRTVDAGSYAGYELQEPTWAQAFWWSHWVLPSPSQAYEMYFRLRADRNRSFDPPFARDLEFGLDDLNLLLRANDYPPKLRPLLAAIAHRIPGIRFLRQLRATEVFDKAAVKELLLRQGYSAGDAAVLAESVERSDRDARRKTIEQQAKGQLARYWELGAIDRDQYRDLLIQHGLTPNQANETTVLADLDLKAKRLQKLVNFIHRQMITGAIGGANAADQLRQAGVVAERVQTYIQDWNLEIIGKHKTISAQKAVQWACKGLITLEDLQARLLNLGYRPQDIGGLIGEARVCQATLSTRAATQADRVQRQTARQLQQQQKAAAQAIVAARRQLAAHGSPSQLRKWFCAGHIGQPELYARLRFLGWPDGDITRLVSDCKASAGGGKGGKRGGSVLGG